MHREYFETRFWVSVDDIRHFEVFEESDWVVLSAFATTGQTWTLEQNAVADLVNSAEQSANRGQANGYASLDSTGRVPLTQWADQVVDGGGATVTVVYTIDGGTA